MIYLSLEVLFVYLISKSEVCCLILSLILLVVGRNIVLWVVHQPNPGIGEVVVVMLGDSFQAL